MTERPPIDDRCLRGLHGFCPGTADTCACPDCHLGPCAGCGATNLRKLWNGLCVDCERARIYAARPVHPAQPCDVCGAVPAFRNLAHRRNEYLCLACHAASGEPAIYLPKTRNDAP